MSIGTNIKKIRESKNLSVKYVVKQLRIFEKYYSKIERGFQVPNDALLRRIAKVFNLSTNEIINYDERATAINTTRLDLKNLKYKEINIKNTSLVPIKVGSVTYIPIKKPTVREVIFKKPQLLNKEDVFKYGRNINLVGVNDILPSETIDSVSDPFKGLINNTDRPTNPELLNWVEPYKYRGVLKTLFYTEVNSGLKEGDRVFIINGVYDSNKLIEGNKYRRKRDGYKVLFIDNCKLVLDIDYTGDLPYKDSPIDDYINLYVINNESDFMYFNRQITTRGGNFDYKFNQNQNSIVYADKDYTGFSGWGENGGISGSPGFFIKNGTQSWINITSDFISGSFSSYFNSSYGINEDIKVLNGSFTYSISSEVISFDENMIYKWNEDIDSLKWEIDYSYNKALVSKSNFRDGNFRGEWNSGVFGRQDKQIKWEGSPAVWNLGTLLNTRWLSGEMNSIYTLPVSYISQFEDGTPYQKLNAPNNNGWGYNYIIDSDIEDITVNNGNIRNTKIGDELSYSIVEDYTIGTSSNYSFTINKALIDNTSLFSGLVKESDVVNSRSRNTKFENIKSINSSYKNSVIKDSKYLSEESVKILGYEELTLNMVPSIDRPSHKVYRFYISSDDYKKLKLRDRFYIKGLKLNDGSRYPLDFFDKRFRFSTWTEYIDSYKPDSFYKRGIDVAAFISSPKDNEWLYNTYYEAPNISTILTSEISEEFSSYYSVDIFVSTYDIESDDIYQDSSIYSELSKYGLSINNDFEMANFFEPTKTTNKLRDIVDTSDAFIVNSDFESGLIETTDWVSGNHINYNNDVNITKPLNNFGIYDITANLSSSTLFVNTNTNYAINKFESGDDCLTEGNVVFLNDIYYEDLSGDLHKLGDTYKVVNNNFRTTGQLVLRELQTDIISNLPDTGGTFSTPDSNNRYGYVHKSKINTSKIRSGIFRRSYITNSFIENENYDSSDRTFNDLPSIKSLVISDSLFKETGNVLSKATYIYTIFSEGSDKFEDGIVFRSLWNNGTFNNGTFKESTWMDGLFLSGNFYNNRSFNSLPTFDYPNYDQDRIKSYYKSGITSATESNNRHSWRNGEFKGGEFFKSDWENGYFKDGIFNFSNFYNGEISGGFIGSNNVKLSDTKIYRAEILNTTVENATLYASDPNYNESSDADINWYDGTFNNGLFGSNISQTASNTAIWNKGTFNGGQFSSMAKWKDGTFNGGFFNSGFGWTMSKYSNTKDDYGWENGTFNGGIFGNESTGENSTWYNGIFNGGKFVGKIWNDGLFQYGYFKGSGSQSAIINNDNKSPNENAYQFTESFTQSYFGLWKNGLVDNTVSKFDSPSQLNVTMEDFLWVNGTFSHLSGEIKNSVWLDGAFIKGNFRNSSFNPYVKRGLSTEPSFNLDDESCYWESGNLYNSDFYISTWKDGNFNLGNSFGMIWKNGICEYMNAFNIFWENGIWKNGNWNGSYIDYDGDINNEFEKEIIFRGLSWSGSNDKIHVWNVFQEPTNEIGTFSSQVASEPISEVYQPDGKLEPIFNPGLSES